VAATDEAAAAFMPGMDRKSSNGAEKAPDAV
jgi:hypothetical protein